MNSKTFWGRMALVVVLASGLLAPQMAIAAEKPNILFIFADDQAFDTVHSLGNDVVETPNLDRLVERGITFTHSYNMGSWSGAVCIASRTMLNTGRFVWQARDLYNSAEQERQAGRFWSEYMKQAGYETYMTGKWHLKADPEKAFDHVVHVRPGMPNQTKQSYNRPIKGQPDPWSPWDKKFGGFWKGGKHWSEVLGDDAETFLADAAKRDEPFFMYLAFNAPHDPRQSPKEYVEKYPLEEVDLPENFIPEYPYKDDIGCGKGLRDEKLAPFPRTPYAVKVNRQEYYAIITHMDTQVGRILDALEKSGKADNTYIFFTADNGLAVGHHGLIGKQNMYDHSVRVPLVVCGPGVPKGGKRDARVYLQDIMPTSLELAGVAKPDHVQFHSLLPLIRSERENGYEAIYGAYLDLQRMVTEGDFKLIVYPKADVVRLYNVKDDPLEMNDLAADPKHRPTVERLLGRLRQLQKEMGDTLELNVSLRSADVPSR